MAADADDADMVAGAYEQLKYDFVVLQQQVNASDDKVARLEKELERAGDADGVDPHQGEIHRLIEEVKRVHLLANAEAAIAQRAEQDFQDAQDLVDQENEILKNVESSEKIEADAAKCYAAVLQDTEQQCAEEYVTASHYVKLHHEEAVELQRAQAQINEMRNGGYAGVSKELQEQRDMLRQKRLDVGDTMDDLEAEVDRLRSENIKLTLMAAKHLQLETELRSVTDKDKTRLDEFEHEALIVGEFEQTLEKANRENVELRISLNEAACELIEAQERTQLYSPPPSGREQASVENTAGELCAEVAVLKAELASYKEEQAAAQETLHELENQPSADDGNQDINCSAVLTPEGHIVERSPAMARQDAMDLRILEVESQLRGINDVLGQIQSQTATAASNKAGWQDCLDVLLSMRGDPPQAPVSNRSAVPSQPIQVKKVQPPVPASPKPSASALAPPIVRGPSTASTLERGRQPSASSQPIPKVPVDIVTVVRAAPQVLTPKRMRSQSPGTESQHSGSGSAETGRRPSAATRGQSPLGICYSPQPARGVVTVTTPNYRADAQAPNSASTQVRWGPQGSVQDAVVSAQMPLTRGPGITTSPMRAAMVSAAPAAMFMTPQTARGLPQTVLRSAPGVVFPPAQNAPGVPKQAPLQYTIGFGSKGSQETTKVSSI
eukprot:gnl/MRDRNA2_/MRDRNA2_42848_c0_seq1.p1 gnl/MRDRNA2_/MRDRNA2_42848_c0~~gnl/MRDRNA2_/MRDRNA2_42848_c0_seq1.p1  ORF type:complete len:668 (-),score=152.14 gnl/MRDRNA2_/MRDRNA2_42848_c0_seq1:17-2020(-)